MRPPTADEIALAATMTGDPIAANDRATRGNRPPAAHKRPRGRPRKDGQPPHQTPAAAAKERAAAAAKVYAATTPAAANAATIGTPQNLEERRQTAAATNSPPPAKFASASIEERIKNLENSSIDPRARIFLAAFANVGHSAAMKAAGIGAAQLYGFKTSEDFRQLYDAIRAAHDAATIARTCDTLAELANGDYAPKPDRLPPDMRAASLLMPALDPRFKATAQGTANQVQINISI